MLWSPEPRLDADHSMMHPQMTQGPQYPLFKCLSIYFWLRWVFAAARAFLELRCSGFSL